MTSTVRHIAAYSLLAALVVGGLLAPTVHVMGHAQQRAHRHAEVEHAAEQLTAQGQQAPAQWLVGERFERVECPLCVAASFTVALVGAVPSSLFVPRSAAHLLDGAPRFAVESVHVVLVRGPPLAA